MLITLSMPVSFCLHIVSTLCMLTAQPHSYRLWHSSCMSAQLLRNLAQHARFPQVNKCLSIKGAEDVINKPFAFEISTTEKSMYFVADKDKVHLPTNLVLVASHSWIVCNTQHHVQYMRVTQSSVHPSYTHMIHQTATRRVNLNLQSHAAMLSMLLVCAHGPGTA